MEKSACKWWLSTPERIEEMLNLISSIDVIADDITEETDDIVQCILVQRLVSSIRI